MSFIHWRKWIQAAPIGIECVNAKKITLMDVRLTFTPAQMVRDGNGMVMVDVNSPIKVSSGSISDCAKAENVAENCGKSA
jgi:hypothetical protein